MNTLQILRALTTAICIIWLPLGTFASDKQSLSSVFAETTWQDRRDKRQEKGKENKKSEVKEVPQSRKQEKPGEVKPDKREKPKDNKRRND